MKLQHCRFNLQHMWFPQDSQKKHKFLNNTVQLWKEKNSGRLTQEPMIIFAQQDHIFFEIT